MRIHPLHNLKPKTDLSRTSGNNPTDGFIKPMQELTKSVTSTSSKVQELKTYEKAINDPVHGNI